MLLTNSSRDQFGEENRENGVLDQIQQSSQIVTTSSWKRRRNFRHWSKVEKDVKLMEEVEASG